MSEIKSYPFPVLSPNSIDYDECYYNPAIHRTPEGATIIVKHEFLGGGLIEKLIKEKKAAFACIVSLPTTMYRKIFIDDTSELESQQSINYNDSGYNNDTITMESPMFKPVIITKQEIIKNITDIDKLNFLWQGSKITIPSGSIIACSTWERFVGGESGLLKLELDKDLEHGQMKVAEEADGGFRFRVSVAENLFHGIKNPHSKHTCQRISILTHALSAGLSILKERFNEDKEWSWREYINLRLVAERLQQENFGTWEDDNFQPELAATVLYPHCFPNEKDTTGDDDDD